METGAVKGLVARGGFVVDINWNDGKLQQAEIFSRIGGICTIRSNSPIIVQGMKIESKRLGEWFVVSFKTMTGRRYF